MVNQFIKQATINLTGLILTPFLLAIGFIGLSKEWGVGWIWLPLTGLLSLVAMFGLDTVKELLQPTSKPRIKKIVKWVVISFALATASLQLGKLIGVEEANANPIGALLTKDTLGGLKILATTWISLIGEELFTAAVFFPALYFLAKKMSQKSALWLAIIISSLFFGALHLPTYQWNWYQCLVVIGLARFPFTLSWLDTNSLRGGIYVHILYDYVIFLPIFIMGLLGFSL